jgi:hypothetical protein
VTSIFPDITPGVLEMLQEAMKNGSNPGNVHFSSLKTLKI